MPETVNVLLVAHQTAATPALLDAVRERAARGPVKFHLVVPRQPHGVERLASADGSGLGEARDVLRDALPRLSDAAGAPVTGAVGDAEPLMAIHDAVNLGEYHEIIISTLPLGVSRWLKLDLVSKTKGLGLPVTHVLGSDRALSGAAT